MLAIAASVGREFTTELVRTAAPVDDTELVRSLDELWRRGFIREHASDAYDFSHGKLRDVAYDALSAATRRAHHLLIAEALQQVHDDNPDPVSGQVARHYDLAGRVPDAVTWYQRAATQAQRLHANAEAVQLLERARELAVALPPPTCLSRELDILTVLPTSLAGVEGFASTGLTLAQRRAVEVAAILGCDLEPPLLRSLVMSALCRNDFDEARAVAGQIHDAALRTDDGGLLVESEYLLGIGAFWGGALEAARAHFHHVVDRFRPEQRSAHLLRFGHDPKIVCLSRLANTLWFLGDDEGARSVCDDAVRMAAEVGHPYSRGVTHVFAALLAVDLGEQDRVRQHLAVLADERNHPRPNEIMTGAFAGYVDVLDGHVGEGIDRIRAAIDRCDPMDYAPGMGAGLWRLLVAAHDLAEDLDAGLAAADEALALGGSRLWEAEIRRLRAEFLAARGAPPAEVDAELARAAGVARRQGAVGLTRRIEASRTRLLPAS